ncbi:MAG: polysulfide reductase NrfD [Chloroflexi bacterium]|nr:polysulfide reductase NrfD [Chloroflexota bacterium]
MRSGVRNLLVLLWVVALLAGSYAVVLRLTSGHRLAGYGSYVVWGLGVAQYIYFMGISAGAFLLSSLYYIFGLKKLEAMARPALLAAFAGLVAGLVSIWTDLGWMSRAFSVLYRPNFRSMMAWMIWLYTAYGLLLLFVMYSVFKGDQRRTQTASIIGVPLVMALSGGVGALFATLGSRPLWHTPLYPVFFILGALVSAAGLLLAMLALWDERSPAMAEARQSLVPIVLGLLAADVLLEWAEYSVGLWYGIGGEQALLSRILFGQYWWVFWIVHVLLGLVVPAVLLLAKPRDVAAQGAAGLLVVVTYLAVRLNLVIPGLVTPELQGLETSFTDPRLVFRYSPSLFEWGIFLFAAAVAAGLIGAGARYLPITSVSVGRKEEKTA